MLNKSKVGLFFIVILTVFNPLGFISSEAYGLNDDSEEPAKYASKPIPPGPPDLAQQNTYDQNEGYFILVLLISLIALISVCISFYLYRWRRIVSQNNEIVVPETFKSWLDGTAGGVKQSITHFSSAVIAQSAETKSTKEAVIALDHNIKNMIDTYMLLQKALDERDLEIKRLKNGYDADVFRKFLLRFTRAAQIIDDYIDRGDIDSNGLKEINDAFVDALEECGVEVFSPNLGLDYRTADGVSDNPKRVQTDKQEQHFLIKTVDDPGYRRRTLENGYEIIQHARVTIYEYIHPKKDVDLVVDKKT